MSVKFFSYNLITKDSTNISASNVNAQYPLSNLKESINTKKTRSTTESFSITFDLITTQNINSILFNSFSWESVDIKANITSNFTSPLYSTSIIPDEGEMEYDFIYKQLGDRSYRFWQLTFHATAGIGYCEVGKIFLGEKVSLVNDDMVFGWTFDQKDYSVIKSNYVGQTFVDVVPNVQKIINGSFKYLTLENLRIIQRLGDLHSKVYPIWLVADEDENVVNDLERNSMYGYLTAIPQEKNVRPKLYDLKIKMVECL